MKIRARRAIFGILALVVVALVVAVTWAEWRFAAGKNEVEQGWRSEQPVKLPDVGATRSLAILPLVDWSGATPDLQGEPGVSYLIKTDRSTILFDVGVNLKQRDPSPLLANMQKLGVSLADFDTVIISHNHMDHVGGLRRARSDTFSLGNEQVDLRGKKILTPVPMTYPGTSPTVAHAPAVVSPGVVTTGTIAGQMYIGRIDEQALAINVEGKGIVLVVGCGHQTLDKLLTRTAQLFGEPIYGVIGGLHYPVPRGRILTGGIDVQKVVVFGPFRGPTERDVAENVALLARRNPQWVSLSAHDSSDYAIEQFRREFGRRYHDLRVGDWQVLAGEPPVLGNATH